MTVTLGGTAQSGTSTTIVLASAVSLPDDTLNGQMIALTAGTGISQVRLITDFVGSTDTCTITPAWVTNPSSDSVYEIEGGSVSVEAWLGTVVAASIAGVPDTNAARIAGSANASSRVSTWFANLTIDVDIASATSTTIVFNAMVATDDYYNGMTVLIYGGTGVGQSRTIIDYVGSTQTATISPAWGTDPDNTSDAIIGTGPGVPDVNVAQWLGTAVATPTVAGVPEVDVVQLNGDIQAAAALALYWDGVWNNLDVNVDSATSSTIVFDAAGMSAVDDFYNGMIVLVYAGAGLGQSRVITDYVGSTKSATVDPIWGTNPNNTSDILVVPGPGLVLDQLLSDHTIAGSLSQILADIETDTSNDDNTYEVG